MPFQTMQILFKALLILLPVVSVGQIQSKAFALKRFIEKSHYAPRAVNDSFSSDLFFKMLDDLDPYKIYFDDGALKTLEPYRSTLDDELNGKQTLFTKELALQYHQLLSRWERFAKNLLEKPITLPANASFQYGKNAPFAKDSNALKIRWQQYLQWRILSRMYEKWEYETEDSSGSILPAKSSEWFVQAEKTARAGLAKRVEQRILENEKQGLAEIEKMVNNMFLHAIAQCFDPHTDYFDSEYNKAFSESLSSEVLEFGFAIEEAESGDVIISDLKPGSAAWNSGNIYPDDKLVQIKTKTGKIVHAKEDGYQAISKALSEANDGEIEITLRSADGNTRQVKLAKQEADNEENIVRGYLLNGSKRLGYIALPSFYTSWEDQAGEGCANDLSKEIIKLKREKIDGLILDLRYNGGGSLQEAIEISGIFIEAGPMTIIRAASGERATLKDPSRGSIYDGPLMVLINGQSASASELVAATLQDYKRAVIMGSPTFGKATMQVVLPLDTNIISNRDIDERKYNPNKKYDDYVKVTTGKLYRISGETNQQKGVLPDIELPDAFAPLDYTERTLEFALQSDTIVHTVAYTPVTGKFPSEKFSEVNKEVNKEAFFEKLDHWITEMKSRFTKKEIPLQWEAFTTYESLISIPKTDSVPVFTSSGIHVENTSYTNRLLELENAWQKESNQLLLEDLLTDPYIRSAYYAMTKLFF